MDFLWHKVSEKEKESIRKEAKFILDSFSLKLSKIDHKTKEIQIIRGDGQRTEGENSKEEISREIMFKNALNKKGDFIVAEKKKW